MGHPQAAHAATGRDVSPRQDLSLRLALRIDRKTLARIEAFASKESVSKSEAARVILASALEDASKVDRARDVLRQKAALRARLTSLLNDAVEAVLEEEL